MSERGSAGGIAYAKIQRAEALEAYYKNPNICQHCHNIIHVLDNQKVKDVKVKKFCNRSCAAQYYADIQKEETQKKRIVEREEKERQRQEIKKGRIFSEDFSPILKKQKENFSKNIKIGKAHDQQSSVWLEKFMKIATNQSDAKIADMISIIKFAT